MITLAYEDEQLLLKASGNNFTEQIESIKLIGARYESKQKVWTIGVGKFDEVIKELSQYKLDIDEYSKQEIKKYFDRIDELKIITQRSQLRKYKPELLSYQPLKDFQFIDFNIAINTKCCTKQNKYGDSSHPSFEWYLI